jgi:hypothetical protein
MRNLRQPQPKDPVKITEFLSEVLHFSHNGTKKKRTRAFLGSPRSAPLHPPQQFGHRRFSVTAIPSQRRAESAERLTRTSCRRDFPLV